MSEKTRCGEDLRQPGSDEAARTTRRTGVRLCIARIGRGELRFSRYDRRDGRNADHLIASIWQIRDKLGDPSEPTHVHEF